MSGGIISELYLPQSAARSWPEAARTAHVTYCCFAKGDCEPPDGGTISRYALELMEAYPGEVAPEDADGRFWKYLRQAVTGTIMLEDAPEPSCKGEKKIETRPVPIAVPFEYTAPRPIEPSDVVEARDVEVEAADTAEPARDVAEDIQLEPETADGRDVVEEEASYEEEEIFTVPIEDEIPQKKINALVGRANRTIKNLKAFGKGGLAKELEKARDELLYAGRVNDAELADKKLRKLRGLIRKAEKALKEVF